MPVLGLKTNLSHSHCAPEAFEKPIGSSHQKRCIGSPDGFTASPISQLSQLNVQCLKEGLLQVVIPLSAGNHQLPAFFKDAKVKVPVCCSAKFIANLRHKDARTVINGASLEISPPIVIKNPASALKPLKGVPAGVNGLLDKLADVKLTGFRIDPNGAITPVGMLTRGVLKPKPLHELGVSLPLLDLDLERFLKGQSSSLANLPINLPSLMSALSQVTGEATYELNLKGAAPELKFAARGIKVWTNKLDIDAHVEGNGRLTKEGNIELWSSGRGASNHVNLGASELSMQRLEACVDGLLSQRPKIEAHVGFTADIREGNLQIEKMLPEFPALTFGVPQTQVSGHLFLKKEDRSIRLQDASCLKAQTALRAPLAPFETHGVRALLSDIGVVADLGMNVEADQDGLAVTSAQARIEASAKEIDYSVKGIGGSLKGSLLAQIDARKWTYHAKDPMIAARGTGKILMSPQDVAYQHAMVAKQFEQDLAFSLVSDKRLAIQHDASGLAHFAAPMAALRVGSNVDGYERYPVGSAGFKKALSAITNAPIQKHNHLELLVDGVQSLPKRLEILKSAQKSICYQTLVFKNDATGKQIAAELIAAKKRGVAVRVIVDAIGNVDKLMDVIAENPIYDRLRSAGVDLQLYKDIQPSLMKLFMVLADYPEVADAMTDIDLTDPSKILPFVKKLVDVAAGQRSMGFDEAGVKRLRQAFSAILTGGQSDQDEERVDALVNAIEDERFDVPEILELISGLKHLNNRWHQKYLIVDGYEAIVGGLNTADAYLLGGTGKKVESYGHERAAWRDTDLYVRGHAAYDAYRLFATNYQSLTGQTLDDSGVVNKHGAADGYEVQMVQSCPDVEGRSTITDAMLYTVNCLKPGERAYFGNAYVLPTGGVSPLKDALMAAAQRGVDVRIMTNSTASEDNPIVRKAGVAQYRDLLSAGVRIFEQVGTRTYHSKTAALGNRLSMVGSWNMDNRSTSINAEDCALIHSRRFHDQVTTMLLADMAPENAKEVKLDEIAHYPVQEEFENAVLGLAADFL